MNEYRSVIHLWLFFVGLGSVGLLIPEHQLAAQEYESYEVRDWNPQEEDWDFENLEVMTEPEFGDFFQDVHGNFLYQNTDSSSDSDQFSVMMSSNDILAEVMVFVDKTTGSLFFDFKGSVENTNTDGDPSSGGGTGTVGSRVPLDLKAK
ncbi:hypothetical protein OAG68_01270 [bacterium]|nr:hypothetical protein [bacterium]